ncbi:MAG TPA: hypothetical protein VHV52_02910 [Gaiellaceae bacterium]|jgi:hypothetical protein|nr:hypothetical protein [Gaiellaceae bacterium]
MSFDDIVGREDLSPDEEARLRRVHDLLVEAGPPPDLPPELEHPVQPKDADVLEFPLLMRRRIAVAGIAAVAAAIAVFAGGYAFGHSKGKPAAFAAVHVVPMHGSSGRLAVIKIGHADAAGNWPMLIQVSGLPKQSSAASYYELWLTRNGKPIAPCGGFRVHGDTTTVHLTVPYSLKKFDGWVVTAQPPSDRGVGPVVLTT